jgi:putative restriction endonuclease
VRYWWVNQNQTFKQEQEGGYLWSPKRNKGDRKNPFYETMREVSPGDIVFAFKDTFVAAIGVAQSYCWESPKPTEFGSTGDYWSDVGWKVRVQFTPLARRMRPKDHMPVLRPLLPDKYAPLQPNGNGIQSVYLTELPASFAEALAGLIGAEARTLIGAVEVGTPMQTNDDLDWWEHRMEVDIDKNTVVPPTEREAIIRARQGQGVFKQRVMTIERHCRITKVSNLVHLIASHCKPWRDSNNDERLNGENGLLLTPSIDHLFDRGFIGFEDDGTLIISPVAHKPSLERMGIDTRGIVNVGARRASGVFSDFRRKAVLLQSPVEAGRSCMGNNSNLLDRIWVLMMYVHAGALGKRLQQKHGALPRRRPSKAYWIAIARPSGGIGLHGFCSHDRQARQRALPLVLQ